MRPRLTAFWATVFLLAAFFTTAQAPPADAALAGAGVRTDRNPPSPLGPRLEDPPEIVSHHGILRASITVERKRVQVGDQMLYALTYNGRYMPPTLRARPGDVIELRMTNRVDQDTNIHLHGLHVSPRPPADDIFIAIPYGQSRDYRYELPKSILPGTYWYHSHAHFYSAAQVAGGQSGVLIIDDLRQYLPDDLKDITEHTIGLKDDQVDGDSIKTSPLSIGAATNRTVNGQQNPVIHMRPGETQLWRLANIGANIYYKLHLPGSTFHVIGQDGHPVSRVYSASSLVIAAGARFDVLVQAGQEPGVARLETLPYDTGPAGNQFPQADLATVLTEGKPMKPARLPSRFGPEMDLSHAEVAARKTVTYTENADGTEFYINGNTYDPDRIDFTSRLNTVEEWTVQNNTDEQHSFHVHTNQFQLMSVNGAPVSASRGWYDTVTVPVRGTVVIRTKFLDFTGKTVLHCHILNHENMGMMAVLDIVRHGVPSQAPSGPGAAGPKGPGHTPSGHQPSGHGMQHGG
ncbi:multicopper oxidase family protein [Streptomyces erythrochromogenes]|uniref:multicopper oxidase family protein n=1 Tax=Streptomyces erythrochromogenes TaxID=285574 RepID=UPI0034299AE6